MATTAGGTYYAASTETVSGYPAISLNLANQLESRFAAKSDYAPTQNTQTGTGASAYTFVLADATRLTVANAATAATYTIPPAASVAWVANTIINVASIGAGTITFAAGAGVTVTNTAGTLAQYQSAMLVRTALNAWTVVPFAGGASLLKSSDVSATTGSPTITTSGGFTIYQFNGSGSITLSKAGLCDLLAVGGGGGGGAGAGGGGAGGHLSLSGVYLPSGAITITVGAGGASQTPGNESIISAYVGVGGGQCPGSASDGSYGGSGGGGGRAANIGGRGVAGQGNTGGNAASLAGGGGGGAGAVGGAAGSSAGGAGGAGAATSITGSSVTRAGGGGGWGNSSNGAAGSGGGGAGAAGTGGSGSANTGGGGGGGGSAGGPGGSGVLIVKVVS
jgi:hypothetical protein